MIDQQVFKTSRERARLKLDPEEAKNSFGYYIDIPNDWESYRCPEELIPFLGIHSTHIANFQRIVSDLGSLTEREREWTKNYVHFYENIARLLSTSGARVDFRYDIAETLFDWRTVESFIESPCKILDFGAGCGRQAVSSFFRNPDNIYTAIDSTLAAYTLQNLAFSYLDTLDNKYATYDFLDFEVSARPFPKIADASVGSRFHIPTWLAEDNVPEKYYDIIFGCHVHNELSGPDFLRFMRIAEKSLADDGVLYLRSEVTVIDPYDFFDAVDLHAIDPIKLLSEKGIVPIYSVLECAYLTTVFAREGSTHHKKALASKAPENSFTGMSKARDISVRAGSNFVKHYFEEVSKSEGKVAMIGDMIDFAKVHVKTLDFKNLIKSAFNNMFGKHAYNESSFLGAGDEPQLKKFCEYDPEIIVISSYQYPVIEEKLKQILPDSDYALRRQYWFPVVFLYKKSIVPTDEIFEKSIMGINDIEEYAKLEK